MGDAQRKLEKAGELVRFDASSAGLRVGKVDRAMLARQAEGGDREGVIDCRAVDLLARTVVGAAYEKGIDRRDGKLWAAWQDFLDDEAPGLVTRGMVDWLRNHCVSDSLKLPPAFAGWREALGEYLTSLQDAAAVSEAPAPLRAMPMPSSRDTDS